MAILQCIGHSGPAGRVCAHAGREIPSYLCPAGQWPPGAPDVGRKLVLKNPLNGTRLQGGAPVRER